jgi:cell division protein FtsQ
VSTATRPAPPPSRVEGGVRRSTWAARLLVVLAVVTVLVALAYGASVSPFLDVDTLTVRGTARTTPEQVLDAGGLAEGDPLYWLDTGATEARIEALPFVAGARVVREWPGTVRVAVTERAPAAWAEVPGGMVVVDRTGRVLERVDAPPAGLPQLVGLRTVPDPGARVVPAGPARIAGALPALAAGGTRSVAATDEGPTMQLVNGVEVRFGDTTRLGAKLRAMAAVFAAMEGRPLAYVDVSVATNPVAG